jgi:alpha-1,3-rhamnosyl/mannosyltransferase
MRAGVPVLAGRAGSLPEVLGDAAWLADPLSLDDLAAGLQAVVGDPRVRTRLVDAGAVQAARYTWAAATDGLVACYEALQAGRLPPPPSAYAT